jgi:hypothetical protein
LGPKIKPARRPGDRSFNAPDSDGQRQLELYETAAAATGGAEEHRRCGQAGAPPRPMAGSGCLPTLARTRAPTGCCTGGCPTRSRGVLKPGSLRRWRGEAAWDRLPPGARAGGLHVTCGIISWPIQVTTEECVLLLRVDSESRLPGRRRLLASTWASQSTFRRLPAFEQRLSGPVFWL